MRIISDSEFDPYADPPIAPYDWELWLSGQAIVLTEFQDFRCSVPSMIVYLRRKASQAGLKITINRDYVQDTIIFRTYHDGDQRPYLPISKQDHLEREIAIADQPKCRVCQSPLNGLSYIDGMCMTIDPTTRQILPKHTDTEMSPTA